MWHVLIFIAAFVAFECLVERLASPFQAAEKVERKFAWFAAHKDDYDFVFVGSSRVLNQLSPKVFDAQMAALGRPCRSFNLGYAAMFLPECHFLIDQILALHPARLRGMIVELSNPAPRHEADHPLTERDIYWHHATPTLLACAALWTDAESRATTGERVAQVWLQTTIFARCLVHLGDGPAMFGQWWKMTGKRGRAGRFTSDDLGPSHDGFIPLTHTLGHGVAGVTKTGGATPDLLGFQRAVEALRAETTAGAARPQNAALSGLRIVLRRETRALHNAGIQPFFFIGPGTTREPVFLGLHADGTLPTLMSFNDPTMHPDLYAPDVRADRYHLNAAGADLLSRQLAEAVLAVRPHP